MQDGGGASLPDPPDASGEGTSGGWDANRVSSNKFSEEASKHGRVEVRVKGHHRTAGAESPAAAANLFAAFAPSQAAAASTVAAPPTTANPFTSAQPPADAVNMFAAESLPDSTDANTSPALQCFAGHTAAATPATAGTQEHVQHMVGQGIKPMCDLLAQQDDKMITLALEGLENILRVRRSVTVV